jgi:hypothetical protein
MPRLLLSSQSIGVVLATHEQPRNRLCEAGPGLTLRGRNADDCTRYDKFSHRASNPVGGYVMSASKRKALEAIFPKLQKLLPHLGNNNTGEADAARLEINRLLTSVKLDWHDITTLLLGKEDSILDMLGRLLAKDQDILVKLGLAGATFFCATEGAFADVVLNGHRNTWPLSDSEFSDWLLHQFFIEMKKAPSLGAMKQAIRTLSAHAKFDGGRHEVYLRAAKFDGKIYLDVGDTEWHVVEIDASGWRMIQDPPVRFRRTEGMAALPLPERGGAIAQLRPLLNLSDDGFVLYVSYILDALCPGRPHPVLYLAGEEGSAKSTAAKIARSLIDPNTVPLRNLPATVRDLFVSAHGSHSLAFDNVSAISAAISDGLCMIASGGGFGTRRLFTNTAQVLIGGHRPVIINGLLNAINRSDLADRAVIIPMSRISSEQRCWETELWSRFETQRSQIFGALLDCVACGLRRLPHVQLQRLPRMADYALWSVATEAFAPGIFIRALESAAAEATEAVAEADPVTVAIAAFMMGRDAWSGTAAELLCVLSNHDRTEAEPSAWKTWPREASSFGKRLQLAKTVLRKIDIEVVIGRAPDRRRTRTITLRKIEPSMRPQQAAKPDTSDGSDRSDGSRGITKVA